MNWAPFLSSSVHLQIHTYIPYIYIYLDMAAQVDSLLSDAFPPHPGGLGALLILTDKQTQHLMAAAGSISSANAMLLGIIINKTNNNSRSSSNSYSSASATSIAHANCDEFLEEDVLWAPDAISHFHTSASSSAHVPGNLGRDSQDAALVGAISSSSSSSNRMIPRLDIRPRSRRQSAPVQIPHWSTMMGGVQARGKMSHFMDDVYGKDEEDHDDDDSFDERRLPPHELLAQEYARSQRTSFSVCEGLGRTLKGRDLSRVRNAVWNQLGFAD